MKHKLTLVLLGLFLSLTACEKGREGTVPKTDKETVQSMQKNEQERKVFFEQSESEMRARKQELAEITEKARLATGEAKLKLDKQIQRLNQDLSELEQQLDRFKNATGEELENLKQTLSNAIERLKQSIQQVKNTNN